ncbi:MAG: magnesium chelatase subunit H [Oscillochloridaceae bacterium umkhey_bin13]
MAQTIEFVMVLGLQRYSQGLFAQAEAEVRKEVPGFRLHVFEDRDIQHRPAEVEAAIARCSCVMSSLITLAETADWLVPTVERLDPPVVFAFEGLPEVMRLTKVGNYAMGKGGKGGGMPKPVQNVARLLVGNREEDALYGYVKLQKITSKLVNFLPGKKLADFRNWTNVATYWSTRNVANTASMFKLILREYFGQTKLHVPPPEVIPDMGFAHPDAPRYFAKPEEYLHWERDRRKQAAKSAKRGNGKPSEPLGTVAVLSFRSHILGGTRYHNDVVRALEAANLRVLPIFVQGIEGHVVVREWLTRIDVDALINTMGFPLVGGPAGSTKAGLTVAVARELLSKLDVPYMVASPLFVQDESQWRAHGVGPLQATMLYSLPEMDGAISPVVLGGMRGSEIATVPDRLERLATQTHGFVKLRKTANRDKKVAIVVYNYPPGQGNTATAALLDVPASLIALLDRLQAAGYDVGRYPRDSKTLAHCLEGTLRADLTELPADHPPIDLPPLVDRQAFNQWVRPDDQDRINSRWGAFPGDIAPAGRDRIRLGGMRLGNIYIGVQPIIGMPGDPMRLLFDKENTPHHQYALFYKYLSKEFGAEAIIHMGMHGTSEWMPGVQLGMTEHCWPDVLLGAVPNFYVYPINNPAEANIAKRRGYATIIGHAIPPYGRAGLYKELQSLKDLLEEFREGQMRDEARNGTDPATSNDAQTTETAILQKIELLNLDVELARKPGEPFPAFASRAYAYLRELETTLITGSLHVLGSAPDAEEQLTLLVEALKIPRDGNQGIGDLALSALRQRPEWSAQARQFDGYGALLHAARRGEPAALNLRDQLEASLATWVRRAILQNEEPAPVWRDVFAVSEVVPWAMALNPLSELGRGMLTALRSNTQELDHLLHGLDGKYIPAAPGGDLIRDGLSVLPTGRNIHSLDPFRVPSDSAYERGVRIGEALIYAHQGEHDGEYPETIAQVLWGLDAIKTKGESIGVILGLIGARPVKDGQGKIGRYALIPLEELGRPRIDVLMTASGIFRDTFAGTIDMLDRLVREAASADEPEDLNFIRKHVNAMLAEGQEWEAATARVFTQAEGTYGTDVDEAIDGGAWEERQELEELFIKRNAFAFGGEKGGQAQPEVLRGLLKTVGRVAQEIDSVEYGLTDMQHYYGYSGALKAAAERATGRSIALNYVESFTAETKIQNLDQVLRVEYRTKLLNPKWYEGMLKHGHNGAAEIASRFTYMLGWSATTSAVDKWVYDEAANTFVLDDAMRARLEAANPEATRNAVGRLLEANSRGIWQTDDETLDRLRELYADLEDRLEGVS